MLGVSGRTGPLSTTLEEEEIKKIKELPWKQGKETERERDNRRRGGRGEAQIKSSVFEPH